MTHTLASLGWSRPMAAQVSPSDRPARVAGVERGRLLALSPEGPLPLLAPDAGAYAVGDWIVHDGARALRRLAPVTEVARRAAGEGGRQLVAANVDALALVTSCNADFNVAQLERYLALALSSGALPVVVLTRADEADPAPYLAAARRLSPLVTALALDARDPDEAARLAPWASEGRTLALVGSSGVGKTTLRNALTGEAAATAGIREDGRGRHTTTSRALRPTLAGGWLIDTPGMRELGLADAADGIAEVFADIAEIATGCRFRDCRHEAEPGCAVQGAIAAGTLDEARLRRARKLAREDAFNTDSLHQRHEKARAFNKLARAGQARAEHKRRGS